MKKKRLILILISSLLIVVTAVIALARPSGPPAIVKGSLPAKDLAQIMAVARGADRSQFRQNTLDLLSWSRLKYLPGAFKDRAHFEMQSIQVYSDTHVQVWFGMSSNDISEIIPLDKYTNGWQERSFQYE